MSARRRSRPQAGSRSPVQGADGVSSRNDLREFDGRLRLLAFLFFLPFCALGARLYVLQVVRGDELDRLASRNFVREVELPPDRGLIYDAQGRLLAENRPAYDVFVSPRVLAKHPDAVPLLASILNLAEDDRGRLERSVTSERRSDLLVGRDATRDQVAELETRRSELPGVYISVSQQRNYPYDSLTAHLVGFMNEVRDDELADLEAYGYHPGDYVGRTGIERAYEPILRGAPGLLRQVVDVDGDVQPEAVNRQLLGSYRDIDSVAGRNLHLTVDIELQSLIESAMADSLSGAVVAIDPRDGAILGMYSKPGFNPNAWSGRLSEQEKRMSDNDPFHPMLDKTVLSYFPASTFKVITAIAALEEGVVDSEDEIECPGYLDYGNRRFHCWNRYGHGDVNLREALAHSCDVYFYQLGLQLGIDTLAQYASELGLGERPGLGFNGESAGVVPTREWHDEHSPGGFQYGFTVNTSVGQGDTRTSPLQMALAYAAFANGGTLYYPRVVDSVTTADGDVIFDYPPRVRNELSFAPEHIAQIVEGLDAVVNDPEGTAYEQRLPYMHVVGKTGTAQVRSLETVRLLNGQVIHWDRDHAWFVAFAPRDNPQIVVAVFLEHGGQGSSAAAPVAMRVIDSYFRQILGWNDTIERALQTRQYDDLAGLFSRPRGRLPPLAALRDDPDAWLAAHAIEAAPSEGSEEPGPITAPTAVGGVR
ncbi:MAG: penicillin-binding protein 2 [Myxococcales bacterium]|nr:penicillin-binding protein 2 [Myxococcales bacterium]MCB9520104.1 penicillin-binding protein 2 [Myxococcales bacterium]MCB9531830.1 penicillin-binding protein 2 [Myxococcales bacterium]